MLFSLLWGIIYSLREVPIFGNSTLGYYYVEAYVGTPPQKKSLILDTGSHLTIIPCSRCLSCGKHQYGQFEPRDSRSFELARPGGKYFNWHCEGEGMEMCRFSQGYSEGSTYEGYFALDNFWFESELNDDVFTGSLRHVFGCAEAETGEFTTQEADGIIGLGVRGDGRRPPSIVDVQVSEGRVREGGFSVCLGHDGGKVALGGWNVPLHRGARTWLDSAGLSWAEQYNIEVNGISLDGQPLHFDFEPVNADGGQAFLDSGTTFVYFDRPLFAEWKKSFGEFCARDPRNCGGAKGYKECFRRDPKKFSSREAFLWSFPNATFWMQGGQAWPWFAQDFLVPALDSPDLFCVGVKPLKNLVLGAVFMRNFDIFFDRQKKRVGFARAKCGESDEPWAVEAHQTRLLPSSPVPQKQEAFIFAIGVSSLVVVILLCGTVIIYIKRLRNKTHSSPEQRSAPQPHSQQSI